ncbi:MAG: catalase, partial [Isosphaeraceae bacterium]
GQRDAQTHDFVMLDNPVFFVRNVADYVPFMNDFRRLKTPGFSLGKLIALIKVILSPDSKFRLLREAGSKTPDSPLRSQYWSTTPSKLGPGAMKFSARPVLDGTPAPPRSSSKDMLREAMVAHLKDREARFDFLVQLQTDPVSMPVEDPTVPWDAPFQKVATIRIPPQTFDTVEQLTFCENLSFTPWHALPEHRPLGGVNRTRKAVYTALSRQRHELNGVPEREPTPETAL